MGKAFPRAFLGHQVGDDIVGGFWGVVFGINTDQVSGLSIVPYCFIPIVVFHEARVFFEKTVNRVVSTNGG
jgi:hypothetical protein